VIVLVDVDVCVYVQLMKDLEYGEGYLYNHDHEDYAANQQYLPEELQGRVFWSHRVGHQGLLVAPLTSQDVCGSPSF
jgi:hypothetical protein